MEHTYKYTILTAIPDSRRGERVNIGIVVFRDNDLDVRFRLASYKLKALTGATWDSRIGTLQSRIPETFEKTAPAEDILRRIHLLDPIIAPVGMGTLTASDLKDYERCLDEILSRLVLLPRKEKTVETQSRINTEIAKIFKKDKVLAKPDESITKKKIVRGLPVAPNEGLAADFALKNGKMYVASTLDLRKHNATIAEAALKSIVLDKASHVFERVRKIGVYAVDPDMKAHFKQHIELLSDYSDETFNWSNVTSQRKFIRSMYEALPTAPLFDERATSAVFVRRK